MSSLSIADAERLVSALHRIRRAETADVAAGFEQRLARFSQEILRAGKYKRMVKDVARLAQATAFTAEEKGSFYMPIKLDAATLAAAIRDESIEDALGPVRQALDNVSAAKPAFDAIIKKLEDEA